MPLNLNEARRLHDRGQNNPAHCDTCTDPAGAHPVYWPCPTATALGATGRTEWDNTTTSCDTPRPDEDDHQYTTTCVRLAGHNGPHQDYDGGEWTDTPTDSTDPRCLEPHPHPGHCTTPNDPDTCGTQPPTTAPTHQPCLLATGHNGEHYNQTHHWHWAGTSYEVTRHTTPPKDQP